jgi:hypothetical protein
MWVSAGITEPMSMSVPVFSQLIETSGSIRNPVMALDTSKLAAISRRAIYESNVPTIRLELGNAVYFSTLDMSPVCHRLMPSAAARALLSYEYDNQHWNLTRLPIELPFTRSVIALIIRKRIVHKQRSFCTNLDDQLLVFSETLEDHLIHLQKVLTKCLQEGLSVSLPLSSFATFYPPPGIIPFHALWPYSVPSATPSDYLLDQFATRLDPSRGCHILMSFSRPTLTALLTQHVSNEAVIETESIMAGTTLHPDPHQPLGSFFYLLLDHCLHKWRCILPPGIPIRVISVDNHPKSEAAHDCHAWAAFRNCHYIRHSPVPIHPKKDLRLAASDPR